MRWSAFKLVLCSGTNHAICLKVLGDIRDNIGLDVEGSTRETILDSLNSQGDLSKNAHLVSAKEQFLTLEIGHFETQAADQVEVNEGGRRCWQVGRHQTGKRS